MLLTEFNMKDALAVAREETREEDRNFFLELLDKGLSAEAIKKRLARSRSKANLAY